MMDKNRNKKRKIFLAGFFIAVYALYFAFGSYHISDFVTADEHYWVNTRIYTYWHNIFSPEDWLKTKLSDKPGITLALVSGAGLFLDNNPSAHMRAATASGDADKRIEANVAAYTAFRIPLLIFTAIFSLFLFWLIKKVTDNLWIALWSFVLIMLSPIILGISQITNNDALMWSFSCATLLSFIAYLKTEEKKFLILSPIFLGMTLLTKLVAVIFFPFLFMIVLFFIIDKFNQWNEEKIEIQKKIVKSMIAYLITFVGSLVVFSIFMPAVFIKHQLFFQYTIGFSVMKIIVPALLFFWVIIMGDAWIFKSKGLKKIIAFGVAYWVWLQRLVIFAVALIFGLVLLNWAFGQFLVNPDNIINYKTEELQFLSGTFPPLWLIYQFYPFVFSLTPLVLVALFYVFVKFIFKKISQSFLVFIFASFFLAYYLALIVLDMPANIRYSIALYPLAFILAAVGIYEFFSARKLKLGGAIWFSLGIFAISAVSLWLIKPFYFNYTNDLLPKKYSIATAWGYGGYEAAQFLNSLPDARNLVVWSDYQGVDNFFLGTTKTSYYLGKNQEMDYDYLVLTKKGQIRLEKKCRQSKKRICVPAEQYYQANNPVWEMDIDGRSDNFIKIFKVEKN